MSTNDGGPVMPAVFPVSKDSGTDGERYVGHIAARLVSRAGDLLDSTGNAVNAPARRRAAMGARAERPVELDLSRSEAVAMISNSM
jgi:hypothetical protein